MDWMKLIHGAAQPAAPAAFDTGDEIRVWYRILEQGKERLGQFEGVVIRRRGSGPSRTFTVRRLTYGEGVERVFPMDSKTISRIEVLREGKVKRSRLYFLRTAVGKTRIAAADASGSLETLGHDVPIVNKTADATSPAEQSEAPVSAADRPAATPRL